MGTKAEKNATLTIVAIAITFFIASSFLV